MMCSACGALGKPPYHPGTGVFCYCKSMVFNQLVTPNPNIPCQPGWCLQYVRQTFGAPIVEPTATAGWENAQFKHKDTNFPAGCYVPVWFSLSNEPAGHVALMCPDGSVYSTSDNSNVPHHHPSLDDLIAYYWRNPLTYLGWSEDISNVRVVEKENEMADGIKIDAGQADDIANAAKDRVIAIISDAQNSPLLINKIQAEAIAARSAVLVLENMPGISDDVLNALKDKIEALTIKVEIG